MPEDVRYVPLEAIDTSPRAWRPCNYPGREGWQEYVDSLRQHGLQAPVLCRLVDGMYEPITGIRAVLAAREAGLVTIPVIVVECDDVAAGVMAFQARNAEPAGRGIVLERAWALAELEANLGKDGAAVSGQELVSRSCLSKAYVSECRKISRSFPRSEFLQLADELGVARDAAVALTKNALAPLCALGAEERAARLRDELIAAPRPTAATRKAAATAQTAQSTNDYELTFTINVQHGNLTPDIAKAISKFVRSVTPERRTGFPWSVWHAFASSLRSVAEATLRVTTLPDVGK